MPTLIPDRSGISETGQGIDPDAEPGHSVAPTHTDEAEKQDDGNLRQLQPGEQEVNHDHGADEAEEDQQQLALLHHVGLTGLVNELRDLGHALVHRQILHVGIAQEPEQQTQHTDHQP
jgi:hypothetical protein